MLGFLTIISLNKFAYLLTYLLWSVVCKPTSTCSLRSGIFQVKQLDDKSGIKDDAVGRIVKARNQRAIVDCTDANNNTPLSEAAS